MKAFTDINQSRKLAEILPHESADFHFSANQSLQGYLEKPILGNSEYADYSAFPCWSLTALLDVLPPGKILLHDKETKKYKVIYIIDSNLHCNAIDACVEMIHKLHEQKLL